MNVDKCSACGRVVSDEDIDECRLCHAPLCVTCGVFKSGRLLCETCAEKVRDEELKEELDAGNYDLDHPVGLLLSIRTSRNERKTTNNSIPGRYCVGEVGGRNSS
jgi:recombinational DNA repair protein (RecF pathway)